jgi:hypothetical protein
LLELTILSKCLRRPSLWKIRDALDAYRNAARTGVIDSKSERIGLNGMPLKE